MLVELDIRDLKKEFNLDTKGIIQVGSFIVKEYPILQEVGFTDYIFIEANSLLIEKLRHNVGPTCRIFNELITDVDGKEHEFNISNHVQASSILKFKKHKEYYPTLSDVVETVTLKGITMDSLIQRESIDMTEFNFLMIDVQGAEMFVLRGFENNLRYINYIYTELNYDSMYEGCCLETELTEYLDNHGFYLAKSFDTGNGWGDGLYIRRGLRNE